jgi:hypothetical protein
MWKMEGSSRNGNTKWIQNEECEMFLNVIECEKWNNGKEKRKTQVCKLKK